MFNYKIIGQRGVLQDGTPFVLDEGKPLVLSFDVSGDWLFVAKKRDATAKKITKEVKNGSVTIVPSALAAGTYYVELLKVENDVIVDKIICTPICVDTLATMAKGLIVYPEIDAVVERLAELEKIVAEIEAWKDQVAPLIHKHKVTL